MRKVYLGLSASLLALSLAACSAAPTPLDRPGDVPPAFTAPIAQGAPTWPDSAWWNNFQAPELGPLIDKAHAENLDIAEAAARVLIAEAADGVALSALLPTVSANGGVTRSQPRGVPGGTSNSFTATGSASYTLDFFGQERDRLQAARESLRAARYAASTVGLSTEATVAQTYFSILALRERITIANANIAASKRILAIVQAKVSSGVSSNLDLAEQQATVAGQQARLPGLIEQEREARYALAILLGHPPEGFDVNAQNLDGIVSPAVQPGVPSALLGRRPDIAQAEASLLSAHANLDAARAAFFPQIGLTGQAGYAAPVIDNLINPANLAWSIGASLVQTIFDGGRINAQKDSARAQEVELIADYRKVVFSAFSDVESALGSSQADSEQLALITEQEKASAEAFRIAELQYREGTIDITSLLNTQQSLFNAQDTLVQTKLARLDANVKLYMALGGGWTQEAADAAYQNQLDWWPL